MDETKTETIRENRRVPKDRRSGEFDDYWLHWNPERRTGMDRRKAVRTGPEGDSPTVPGFLTQALQKLFQ